MKCIKCKKEKSVLYGNYCVDCERIRLSNIIYTCEKCGQRHREKNMYMVDTQTMYGLCYKCILPIEVYKKREKARKKKKRCYYYVSV